MYQLRNAFFAVVNIRTGETVQFLFSDDMPDAAELTTILNSGSYTVTLQPGWFLERVSSSNNGSGGGSSSGGSPGTGTAGKSSGPGTAGAPEPGPIPPTDPGSSGGTAPSSGGAAGGEGPIEPPIGGTSTGGISMGGSTSTAGSGGSTGGGLPLGFVEAQLLSDAVQFFFLGGGDDAFVNYQFKVGGEIIDFTKGKLHIGIGIDDTEAGGGTGGSGGNCQVPSDVTKPERVLLETNVDAVAAVTLSSVFKALATNGGHAGNGELLYQQIFDSYATADLAQIPGIAHCGDETTNGVPTLNGFPIDCNRAEAQHVSDMGNFFATAFVNRMDLAPANGAHCGQQRMIFANNSGGGGFGRTFMIVEAQVPNPAPELGIDGCRPLAQFWMDQNNEPDAKLRGQRLSQAFLQGGVKGLAEFGFGPFYTAENLTVGSGQIRTNQFDSSPWTLREFKLALDGDSIAAVAFPVSESPNGALWNENSGLPQGDECRQSFLTAMDGVLSDNMALMSFVVDAACKDAESRNDFSEDYASNMSRGFRSQIQDKLASVGSILLPEDVANRARFSGSCIGCHNEASGSSLGNGVFAPFSNDFPQVQEFASQCGDGETGNCFTPSNALNTVFLPGRLQVLANLLGVEIVPNPCTGGGGGGVAGNGSGGSASTGGRAGTGGRTGGTGGRSSGNPTPEPIPSDPQPAPVVVIELPSVDVPVGEMQEEDQEIRTEYGDVTISGRSAKATH